MTRKSRSYADFDIERFLDDYQIGYRTEGKNIGRGWWGLEHCIFCGDTSYHLGVNLKSKKFSCFVCGESCKVPRFIGEALGYEWKQILPILKDYGGGDINEDIRVASPYVIWPSGMTKISQNSRAFEYLANRNFGQNIIDTYRLQQTKHRSYLKIDGHHPSDFRWRIMIPIYMNRKLVAYTGRDYLGNQSPKYRHPLIEASVIATASSIYNYDSLVEHETGIFVEGPTDVWRWGKQTVAMMGVTFTKHQVKAIAEKQLKKAVIAYDEGAIDKARKLAHALIGIVPEIKIATVPGGDPGELNPFDAIPIKAQLMRC